MDRTCVDDEADKAGRESRRPARPDLTATTLVAGAWALVPTTLALLATVAVQRLICSPIAEDCTWGIEFLAAGLVALVFWVVVAPVAVWLKQRRAQNRRAPIAGVITAVLMFIAFLVTTQSGSITTGIIVGVVSSFSAIALAQVVVGRS